MSPRRLLQLLDKNRDRAGFTIVDNDPELDSPESPSELDEPDEDGKIEPGDAMQPGTLEAGTSTIYVYDAIGGFDGIQVKNFVQAIGDIRKTNIHLRINSPGGDVFDARAIKTALEQHPAKVTAFVDGLAASAASFLMLAADNIKIAKGAFVMIHNPWGFAMGDADEMRATAALLDSVGGAIRGDYQARTGLDDSVLAKMMDDETWMSADEAVEKGFCDGILEKPSRSPASPGSAMSKRTFDLSAFTNPPAELIKAASEDWKCGASRTLPLNQDKAWDGPAAEKSIFDAYGFDGDSPDTAGARKCFLAYDASAPKEKGSYKLPFSMDLDGTMTALASGIRAAASRLPQTGIPDDVKTEARAVIESYEKKFKSLASATLEASYGRRLKLLKLYA